MMAILSILSSVLVATSILSATACAAPVHEKNSATLSVRGFDVNTTIPYTVTSCKNSTGICVQYGIKWDFSKDTCVNVTVQAEKVLGFERSAPVNYTCAGDDDGNAVVSVTPPTGPVVIVCDPNSICVSSNDKAFQVKKQELAASASSTLERRLDPNTQSCKSWPSDAAHNYFIVQVAVPWDPSKCDPLNAAINVHRDLSIDEKWACQEDWEGGFMISFNDVGSDAEALLLNADFEAAFPTVNGFNCQYGYGQQPASAFGNPPSLDE